MAYQSPAQLFAQLQQKAGNSPTATGEVNEIGSQRQGLLVFREMGFALSAPDRIKCVVLCSSTKVLC